jgi:hypothetical protein
MQSSYPFGLISVKAYPVEKPNSRGICLTRSDDLDTFVFMLYNDPLRRCSYEIVTDDQVEKSGKKRVYTPCMIDEEMFSENGKSYHMASLLVPPEIYEMDVLFAKEMAVPKMRVVRPEEKNGKIIGYVMASPEFTGEQKYFSSQVNMIKKSMDRKPKVEFQGKITQPPKIPGYRPWVVLKISSEHTRRNNAIIKYNNSAIEKINSLSKEKTGTFWWEAWLKNLKTAPDNIRELLRKRVRTNDRLRQIMAKDLDDA